MVIHHYKQEIPDDLAGAHPRGQFHDYAAFRFWRNGRAAQKRPQFGCLMQRRAKIFQLLQSWFRCSLLQGDIRQRICILQARRFQFGLPCRLCTKLLINASCAAGVICLATRDSAPSTANLAASAFNSTLAARSAASISATAAMPILPASLFVTARSRSISALASRCAVARNSAISLSRLANFAAASWNFRSASAFAAVALVIAALMLSALRRNQGGNTFAKSQYAIPARITK